MTRVVSEEVTGPPAANTRGVIFSESFGRPPPKRLPLWGAWHFRRILLEGVNANVACASATTERTERQRHVAANGGGGGTLGGGMRTRTAKTDARWLVAISSAFPFRKAF